MLQVPEQYSAREPETARTVPSSRTRRHQFPPPFQSRLTSVSTTTGNKEGLKGKDNGKVAPSWIVGFWIVSSKSISYSKFSIIILCNISIAETRKGETRKTKARKIFKLNLAKFIHCSLNLSFISMLAETDWQLPKL